MITKLAHRVAMIFKHPVTKVIGCVILAAVLTYLIWLNIQLWGIIYWFWQHS